MRTLCLALLILVAGVAADDAGAQITWQPAANGAEGADLLSIYRTPGGAMLGGAYRRLVRRDPLTERWEQTYHVSYGASDWRFGSDASGTIYATAQGSLHRSSDDGRTWTELQNGSHADPIRAMASDEGRVVVLFASGRGRSTDGGATWQPTNRDGLVAVTFTGPSRLLAALSDAVYESLDTGRTWRAVTGIPGWTHFLVALDSATVLHGTDVMLGRSTDGGRTWRHDSLPGYRLAVMDSGELYLSSIRTDHHIASDGVYRSSDRGVTWTRVSTALAWEIRAGRGSELWGSFPPHVMRSTDGGGTWTREVDGLNMRWSAAQHRMLTGSDGRIYAMLGGNRFNSGNGGTWLYELMATDDDGLSWRSLHDSVGSTVLLDNWGLLTTSYSFRDPATEGSFFERLVRFSSDRGARWRTLFEGGYAGTAATPTGFGIINGFDNSEWTLDVTADSGATWRRLPIPFPLFSPVITESGAIIAGTIEYLGGSSPSHRLVRSDDTGATWRTLRDTTYVDALHDFGGGRLIVLTYPRDANRTAYLLRSTDGGETWTEALPGLRPGLLIRSGDALVHIDSEAPIPHNRTASRSTDGGETWRHVPVDGWFALVPGPHTGRGNELFAYHEGDLLRSTDHGATWPLLSDGDPYGGWRWVATNDRVMIGSAYGLYRTTAPAGIDAGSPPHGRLALTPLPARDHVVLDAPSAGTLSITGIDGAQQRRVRVEQPGTLVLDLRGLAAGHYLLQLVAGDETWSTQLIVR